MEDHPEEEVEKDEDEEDRWWEEKQEVEEENKVASGNIGNKTTGNMGNNIGTNGGNRVSKKDAGTDPWEWRGSPKENEEEEEDDKKTRGPAQTIDDFENDNGLKGLGEEGEEERDICNFNLDLYSGSF